MKLPRACIRAALVLLGMAGIAAGPTIAAQVQSAQQPSQVLIMLRLPPPHLRPGANYSGSYSDTISQAARRRIAQRVARRRGMTVADGWPMPLLGVDCFVLQLPTGMSLDQAVDTLSREKIVLWAQPMQLYRTQGHQQGSRDPLYPAQPAAGAWRLSDLHRYFTGRGATVAVVDSKVETGHPDLLGQFSASKDFVGGRPGGAEPHGTGIAGVIGAKADNGLGIAGIAPGARLMALRACWETAGAAPALCNTLSLAKALHFAIEHKAQIINMSLSGPPDMLLDKLLDIALAHRISVVAAYDAAAERGGFPASKHGVIAVADESLRSRPASVYAAPGQDIPTTQPGGRWYIVNGSSYAAAHISGLLALAREERGAFPSKLVVGRDNAVDACATLLAVSPACDCACTIRGARKVPARH